MTNCGNNWNSSCENGSQGCLGMPVLVALSYYRHKLQLPNELQSKTRSNPQEKPPKKSNKSLNYCMYPIASPPVPDRHLARQRVSARGRRGTSGSTRVRTKIFLVKFQISQAKIYMSPFFHNYGWKN